MIYSVFIVPFVMMLSGYFMYKHTPNKINKFVGYRTSNSMKNKDIWNCSNQSCGKLWIKIEIVILIINVLLLRLNCFNVLKITEELIEIIIIIEIIPMLLSIFIIENNIKKYEKIYLSNFLKNKLGK